MDGRELIWIIVDDKAIMANNGGWQGWCGKIVYIGG